MNALQKAVDYYHDKEALTEQVRDLLDLLIPDEGNGLVVLGEWHHSPALEPEIIGWLASALETEGESRARHRRILMDGDRPAEVHACHMLDDYWQVRTSFTRGVPKSPSSKTGTLTGRPAWPWPASRAAEARCPNPSSGLPTSPATNWHTDRQHR